MRSNSVSPKQTIGVYDNAVSTYIDQFWREHFRSPTIREIQAACGTKSTSSTANIVRRIAKQRGDTLLKDGKARGIIPRWVIHAIRKYDIDTQHLTKPMNAKAIYP